MALEAHSSGTRPGAVPAPPPDYIYYPRLDGPAREIRRCLELSQRYGQPYSMALEGVANAGKSAFVYHLMQDFPGDETPELTRIPVVYVELSSPITRNGVGRAILEAFGDPGPYDKLRYDDLTRRVRALLLHCQVRLVILDDFHHLIRNEQIDWEIAEWLKVLIKGARVPFLVIGIAGKVQRILRANAQLSKLFIVRERLHPLPWDEADDALVEEFGQFVTFVEASVGLRLTRQLGRVALLGLVHWATGGIVGDLVTFLRYAGAVARDRAGDSIELADLAHGFEMWLREHRRAEQEDPGRPLPNPFIAPQAQGAPGSAAPPPADAQDPPEGVNRRSRARKRRPGQAQGDGHA